MNLLPALIFVSQFALSLSVIEEIGGFHDLNGVRGFDSPRDNKCVFGRLQSVGITGKLTCNGKPASDVSVKLYDHDVPDFDDLMDKGTSGEDGRFSLKGTECETTEIDPLLKIYHDCNDNLPCKIKVPIQIPSRYVTVGDETPDEIYDAGTIELGREHYGQSRDCLRLDG
ncbi:transthyretin-like family domain-containing protein [Ditylenchus destructor]|uniref:Transthyretin-like family domain-containing protein n=1 Tax=Ditylenchus destructor TaxID=166010 RepID=A0AAD4MPB0_9BILA|nr:transthyretin-like family domain-containing protein [Ditylenchus destructor]